MGYLSYAEPFQLITTADHGAGVHGGRAMDRLAGQGMRATRPPGVSGGADHRLGLDITTLGGLRARIKAGRQAGRSTKGRG